MKSIKRKLAALLAALMIIPTQPVLAANTLPAENYQEVKNQAATPSDGDKISEEESALKELSKATSGNAEKKPEEEVIFNTGSCEYSVVGYKDFWDNQLGDACFETDGSYTINIPEENPFFPYEVQFTYEGDTVNKWFMTPGDSVEVGGHTFRVSAYFDDTAVTQMSLEVAGNTVVVYPKEKDFKDGDGAEGASLLPLEERYLTVDFQDYTPAELTMVSIASMFAGDTELKDTDKVMWSSRWDEDYTISSSEDVIDLSYDTSDGYSDWEMIVGENDQLAGSNIRYFVTLDIQASENWLISTVAKADDEGKRTAIQVLEDRYYDYDTDRYQEIRVSSEAAENGESLYVGLKVDPSVFDSPRYDQIKIYEGRFLTAAEAVTGEEITDRIYDVDVSAADMGYPVQIGYDYEQYITIVTYNADGDVTGCLPIELQLDNITYKSHINVSSLAIKTENSWDYVSYSSKSNHSDGVTNMTKLLYSGYPADGLYHLTMNYYDNNGNENKSKVTAAYAGQYKTIEEAQKAGAIDIKENLFGDLREGGYAADYSEGVYFTIFAGEDGSEEQEIFIYCVKAEEGTTPLDSSTAVNFYGLMDKDGNTVQSYEIDDSDDSYAENNFLTILVDEDVDLTSLAPIFSTREGLNLYAAGSSAPEISGKSLHDFSGGPVQYTAAAENGTSAKNYWLQVVKAAEGEGWIYINSLADDAAETRLEDNVTYSTREVLLDGFHNYEHDILIANMGKNGIASLSAELVSDEVELDDYWTLKGEYELSGFPVEGFPYEDLQNLAKIRIKAKETTERGEDISGTLTIKSGDTVMIVLTLTGTVGDPGIITKDIPQAVKYVPYGTMIQNSNKYSWNEVSYRLLSGKLPAGMELKPNGEIYGVPSETGEFTFTVRMENSARSFSSSSKTFTLVVNENTDANVDAATDEGYILTQRVSNITLNSTADQLIVSEGVYEEFVDIYLDGVKLQKDVDYNSESGSTKITIRSQTLKDSGKTGTRTLGIEFRSKDTNDLKRAAQNYKITGDNSGGSSGGNSGGSGGSGGSVTPNKTAGSIDPVKGYVNSEAGIVTGEGANYSHWQQDENGWRLNYANGTVAAGYMAEQTDKTATEQVAWEKVNGTWYAFGVNGYVKSGWVFDQQLSHWYYMSAEHGMKAGWHSESQDGCTYYMDPATGQLLTGWRQIDGKWHYFNGSPAAPTWLLDENTGIWSYKINSKSKPFGAMYNDEKTPDGYYVNTAGIWDGNES